MQIRLDKEKGVPKFYLMVLVDWRHSWLTQRVFTRNHFPKYRIMDYGILAQNIGKDVHLTLSLSFRMQE